MNVLPESRAHGPLTQLYVRVPSSVLFVVALTLKSESPNVGDGALPNVMVGSALDKPTVRVPLVAAV